MDGCPEIAFRLVIWPCFINDGVQYYLALNAISFGVFRIWRHDLVDQVAFGNARGNPDPVEATLIAGGN